MLVTSLSWLLLEKLWINSWKNILPFPEKIFRHNSVPYTSPKAEKLVSAMLLSEAKEFTGKTFIYLNIFHNILLKVLEMSEVNVPEDLKREIKELPADPSKFAIEAMEEKLAELRLERSKAFKKLLLEVFNRMTEDSELSDEDCLRLGRKVNEEVARKYGLVE